MCRCLTYSEGEEGHQRYGVRAEAPVERSWGWVFHICCCDERAIVVVIQMLYHWHFGGEQRGVVEQAPTFFLEIWTP